MLLQDLQLLAWKRRLLEIAGRDRNMEVTFPHLKDIAHEISSLDIYFKVMPTYFPGIANNPVL